MWKNRSPARTKLSSQECQVQGMPQNRAPSQGLPKQEESHPEGSPHYSPQNNDDTHIDELGDRQPNPPRVNMLKLVNHIEANSRKFNEGKHLKFPIVSHPRGPYNHHITVRVDTGADVHCMNEKTFNELFPEVQISVCPHEIQNFGNSISDISILGQFHTYLEFRGEKYLNTFIITDVTTPGTWSLKEKMCLISAK